MRASILVAAAVVCNAHSEILLVRKRETVRFMLPGGKIGPHETTLEALRRELWEELNCGVETPDIRFLGIFSAPAAHEPDEVVDAHVYAVTLSGTAVPGAEIEELMWMHLAAADRPSLAPLVQDVILPLMRQRADPPSSQGSDG